MSALKPCPEVDAHLVSICDVTQINLLAAIRKKYPEKRIIAGGHFCVNFMACGLFADLVNIGQGFELFRCKTFEEMAALDCVYFKGKEKIILPSTFIDWKMLPVVQTSDRMFYYMGGTGCKNKCRFCLTSWTNKHQKNEDIRILMAAGAIPRGARLNIISNEYDLGVKRAPVKDMMLRDFLQMKQRTTRLVRMGLEFASEENRRRFGKAFTDDELFQAMEVAKNLGVEIQLFCIGGIDPPAAWLKLFERLPVEKERSPRIYFKFTNLAYEQFTPLYKERFKLKPENYLDGKFGRKLFNSVAVRNKRVRIFPIAYPALAFWRMGMQHVTDMDQYQAWAALRKEKDLKKVSAALASTNVINTDYQNKIRFWYQEEAANG